MTGRSHSASPPPPLRVGWLLTTFTGGLDGVTPRWDDLRSLVRLAEDAGFDSVWVPDELIWHFDDAPTLGFWESWTLVSAIAAITSRIEIGTLVSCTQYRSPALLAKMADTADEVSGGRFTLGLGAGWSADQFRAFGAEADHPVDRFEEALSIVQALLRDGHISFSGRHYKVADCVLEPRGPRPGGIPIVVGGLGPRMLRLAARHADAWSGFLVRRDLRSEIPRLRGEVDAACRQVGRDPSSLPRMVAAMAAFGDRPVRLGPSDWTERALRGSPEEIAAQMRWLADQGVTHLQLGVLPTTPSNLERLGTAIEVLRGATDASS